MSSIARATTDICQFPQIDLWLKPFLGAPICIASCDWIGSFGCHRALEHTISEAELLSLPFPSHPLPGKSVPPVKATSYYPLPQVKIAWVSLLSHPRHLLADLLLVPFPTDFLWSVPTGCIHPQGAASLVSSSYLHCCRAL